MATLPDSSSIKNMNSLLQSLQQRNKLQDLIDGKDK